MCNNQQEMFTLTNYQIDHPAIAALKSAQFDMVRRFEEMRRDISYMEAGSIAADLNDYLDRNVVAHDDRATGIVRDYQYLYGSHRHLLLLASYVETSVPKPSADSEYVQIDYQQYAKMIVESANQLLELAKHLAMPILEATRKAAEEWRAKGGPDRRTRNTLSNVQLCSASDNP